MTFGHDPFIWTNPQVIKNAETASGTMVFNGMFDWVPGVGDDDEEDDNGGTGIDFIDDIVETVTEWTSKITETFKIGFDFITVKDKAIDVKTITKCCNGIPHKFIYGIYQVNEEPTAKGGPRTVGNEVWSAGDRYATFREYRWTPANYQNGNDNGRWNNYQEGALGRIRATSLSDEYQVLDTGDSQSLKDFYDEVITQRIGEDCEDGPFGCMNETASNYNSNAVCPDGSCECGDDEGGNRKTFNQTGTACVVVPCEDTNRESNDDTSCGDKCKDGFSFKKGVYPKQCVPTPVDCVVSLWSAWSACADSKQTRTRKITTQAAYGGKTCEWVAGTAFLPGSMEREPVKLSQTRTCAMPSTNGTTGRGTDPNNCAQANRVKKDDDTCGDCKTDYEEAVDGECVAIGEPETQEGLPMGLIIGGVALGGLALVMAMR
jgi:hypothetical protein